MVRFVLDGIKTGRVVLDHPSETFTGDQLYRAWIDFLNEQDKNTKGPIMARKTINSMQEEIDELMKQNLDWSEKCVALERNVNRKDSTIKARDETIERLKEHIKYVTAQRNRLVGYVEGSRSLKDSDTVVESMEYPSQPQKVEKRVNRADIFIDSCSHEFVDCKNNNLEITDHFRRN